MTTHRVTVKPEYVAFDAKYDLPDIIRFLDEYLRRSYFIRVILSNRADTVAESLPFKIRSYTRNEVVFAARDGYGKYVDRRFLIEEIRWVGLYDGQPSAPAIRFERGTRPEHLPA